MISDARADDTSTDDNHVRASGPHPAPDYNRGRMLSLLEEGCRVSNAHEGEHRGAPHQVFRRRPGPQRKPAGGAEQLLPPDIGVLATAPDGPDAAHVRSS